MSKLNNGHFICKVVEAMSTLIATKNLLSIGCFKDALHANLISLAFGGGFIAMCVLIYLHYQDLINENMEKTVLFCYGLLNLAAFYIIRKRLLTYTGCPSTIFEPISSMYIASLINSILMLGEALYYQLIGTDSGAPTRPAPTPKEEKKHEEVVHKPPEKPEPEEEDYD